MAKHKNRTFAKKYPCSTMPRRSSRNKKSQKTTENVACKVPKNDSEIETSKTKAILEIVPVSEPPTKRKGGGLNIMTPTKKKKRGEANVPKQPLRVEGYAFHDNIIGIRHCKNDDEDAFNGTLRNKIMEEAFHTRNIHAFVTLRDIKSCKEDLPLQGEDGYNKIMFLNINTDVFKNLEQAHKHVIDKVQTIHDFVTDPYNNRFGYRYVNVTRESDKTGEQLLVLSDVVRYNDTYRVMCGIYGDTENNLPQNFAKKYPDIIAKYFLNVNDIPDPIKVKLGI